MSLPCMGCGKKEAAVQLAQDFGLSYEDWKPPGKAKKPKPRQKSPEEQFQEAKSRCFRILADYLHLLTGMEKRTMPRTPRRKPFIPGLWKPYRSKPMWNICWMCCCSGIRRKKQSLITDYGKDVIQS